MSESLTVNIYNEIREKNRMYRKTQVYKVGSIIDNFIDTQTTTNLYV